MLTCALSGETPQEAVVSRKTGHIFEKRLILQHLSASEKCPVTDQELSTEDLVEVQLINKPVQPRPPTATSISSLLRTFQGEWDSLLLESYELKKHITRLRQELSHTLYQHDAACRVIARVTQERDKARDELAKMQKNYEAALAQSSAQPSAMEVESGVGFTEDLQNKIKEKQQQLHAWRRKRRKEALAGLTTKQQIASFTEKYSAPLHSPSESGILTLALNPLDANTVFTGGVDSTIQLWNRKSQKKEATLTGHKKKVLSIKVAAEGNFLVSGSGDKTIGIWKKGEKWELSKRMTHHSGAVNSINIHPLGDYFGACSDDGCWSFNSLIHGEPVHVQTRSGAKITDLEFHPDGHLVGTGDSNNQVKIFDLKDSQNPILTLKDAQAAISSISFSQNGYHLAVGSADGKARVFDLRKEGKCLKEFDTGSPVNCVQYDFSGQYLACGSSVVNIYQSKSWDTHCTLATHTKDVMDLGWGANAAYIVSCSKDRNLKFYSHQDL